MKIIKGDLVKKAFQGEFDLIVHGCNCWCTMGAGIALQIKRTFPEARDADRQTKQGDREKLGTCQFVTCKNSESTVIVVNAYTQFHYTDAVSVDYSALRKCFKEVAVRGENFRIGIPKIGAGLAGGDWETIYQIIEEELEGLDVTLVEYKENNG